MSVRLHHRITGEGEPLVLLHGLFGSLENLGGVNQRLQDGWQVHGLDLRNHGRSAHTDTMDYPAMAEDVVAYLDEQGIDRACLLGHSMGGKTAMQVALTYPERVKRLIVADIAPVTYHPRHDAILEGMKNLDLSSVKSRSDADQALQEYVEVPEVRMFLLKNLVRVSAEEKADNPDTFRWRLNLPVIDACYQNLADAPEGEGPFEGPVLFIKGAESAYIQRKHRERIDTLFPTARVEEIEGTGHWLHAEKPDEFARRCRDFLTA
ncbi:alpha/beta fold hydrolase [Marinobacter sp. M1N3S26]|uniref:alpha/beta fold hydrolase n=1 Tax=unclassified Marinobacter TaxID=83889 RepID=UPI00387AC62D